MYRFLQILCVATGLTGGLPLNATASPEVLLALIQDGDHQRLERALRNGLDPDARLPDGSLPLAWAVERQDTEAVRLLLAHGAAVNDRNPSGNAFSPMVVACLYPQDSVLNLLLEAGIDVLAQGPDEIPALSLCAAYASTHSVQKMIAAKASVNDSDAQGHTPLMWAAAHARVNTFRLLLDQGADIQRKSNGGFTALMFAVKSGKADIALAALAAGADPTQNAPDGTNLIQLAMYQNNYDFAAHLVGADTNLHAYDRNGRQLLHAASLAGHPVLVQRLLDAGADANSVTAPSTVKWRYESNFRAGTYEFPAIPPLLLAAQAGHADVLPLLVAGGAKADYVSADGNNIVLAAAASGVPEALRTSLDLAPDANVRNTRGETPLHRVLASATGPVLDAMLRLLAEHGAQPDIANSQGKTPAQIAGEAHFKAKATFAALFHKEQEPHL